MVSIYFTTRELSLLLVFLSGASQAFLPASLPATQSSYALLNSNTLHSQRPAYCSRRRGRCHRGLWGSAFFEEDEDDEEEDDEDLDYDDDMVDADSLGDWRAFRRTLESIESKDADDEDDELIRPDSLGDWRAFRRNLERGVSLTDGETREQQTQKELAALLDISRDNLKTLQMQNPKLAEEFRTGVWAHETSTPEAGGLVVRMPLEVELYRNYRHSLTGAKLRQQLESASGSGNITTIEPAIWYHKAQVLVEEEMKKIAERAGDDGQIETSDLSDASAEVLQLYLDNQENWQEVCLVLQRDEQIGRSETVVLNRPMALKLTKSLAQLVLYGSALVSTQRNKENVESKPKLEDFVSAFGHECAVYVGGPQDQHFPALMLHGIADLPGAKEVSPGTQIYEGGIHAAVQGVLDGKYKPLEFRFFVGKHVYEESMLDVAVLLGKYQPVACSRTIPLKQCISLPKPLWHEVNELCGGQLRDISELELLKKEMLHFQIIDEDDEDDYLSDGFDIEIIDELDELEQFDDDDDDDYLYRK